MLGRRTSGSVVCPSCGSLVGVRDDKCYTCGRANPGLWGFGPLLRQLGADLGFVPLVIGASTVLYALTLLASGSAISPAVGLNFLAPSMPAVELFGASGFVPVLVHGAWWTVLSAGWLHGNLLHIFFNMMWVRDLASASSDVIGPARTVIIYTIAGVTGFLFSSLMPLVPIPVPFFRGAPYTLGASAAIFGLLGALVHYGRISGSSLTYSTALRYAVVLFVFGLVMPGVDNTAHAGGFVGGYATSAFFNPMTRERGDHVIAALACLAATFLAILFSVLRGLGIL